MACCVMKLRDSKLQNKKKGLVSSPPSNCRSSFLKQHTNLPLAVLSRDVLSVVTPFCIGVGGVM